MNKLMIRHRRITQGVYIEGEILASDREIRDVCRRSRAHLVKTTAGNKSIGQQQTHYAYRL